MVQRGQVSEGGRVTRPASGVLVNDRRARPRIDTTLRKTTLRKTSRIDAAGKREPK